MQMQATPIALRLGNARSKPDTRTTVFWESSRRPLYPRWVWMPAIGQRHFILDNERTNAVRHNRTNRAANGGQPRELPLLPKWRQSSSCDIADELQQPMRLIEMLPPAKATAPTPDERTGTGTASSQQLGPQFARSDAEPAAPNPLTDRVLQWLDLAGRQHLLAAAAQVATEAATVQPVAKPPRICTAQAALGNAAAAALAPAPQRAAMPLVPLLRRAESMHQLQLQFAPDQQQQRPAQLPAPAAPAAEAAAARVPAPRYTPRHNFGQFLPTAVRCSRAFSRGGHGQRSPVSQWPRPQPAPSLAAAAPSTAAAAAVGPQSPCRRRTRAKRSKSRHPEATATQAEIASQYQALIQRKILENNCNAQAARRQLHIFMPNLPDKKQATAAAAAAGHLPTSARLHLLRVAGSSIGPDEASSMLSTILSSTAM